MAKKYLDYDGLSHFWAKIKVLFSTKSETVTNITRNGTTFTATRADGTNFTFTQQDSGEENQNAFSNVKVGSTTIAADTKTDTIELVAGSNITLTPDATNDKVTIASSASSSPSSTTPKMDGTAAVGTETAFARGDHVHPTDTSRAPLASPAFTGTPTAPTAAATTNNTQIATTEFVKNAVSNATADMLSEDWLMNSSIDGVEFNNANYQDMIHYGECSDDPDILAKTVTCNNFKLIKGSWIVVKFTSTESYTPGGGPFTLNVNNTGAKSITYNGVNGSPKAENFSRDRIVPFIYDGTDYCIATTALNTGITSISIPVYANSNSNTIAGTLSNYIGLGPGSGLYVTNATVSNVQRRAINLTSMSQQNASSGTLTVPYGISPKVLHDTIAEFGGAANGFAPLNSSSKIDSTYLPSYVDDVIEAYAVGSTPLAADWLSLTASGSALTPETGKIYILMVDSGDYGANTQFRWSGSTYVKLNDGGVSSITNSEIDTIVAS